MLVFPLTTYKMHPAPRERHNYPDCFTLAVFVCPFNEGFFTQTSGCGVVLDQRKNSPRQRVFVPGFLTVAITQSDSHKPLTLKFC